MKKMLSILIFLSLIYGCSTKDVELAESHYKLGLAYLNSDTDYLSIVEFEKALAINPDDDRVYYAIATFYIKKNRISDAERYVKQALTLKSDDLEYQNLLATIYATKNEPLKAINIWKKIADDPKYPTPEVVYFNIASAYQQMGNLSEAEFNFKKSIQANPRILNTYLTLSNLYIQQKRYIDAETTLKQALDINPTFNQGKYQLARVYYLQNINDKAITLLKEIITSEPNSREAKDSIELLKEIGLR